MIGPCSLRLRLVWLLLFLLCCRLSFGQSTAPPQDKAATLVAAPAGLAAAADADESASNDTSGNDRGNSSSQADGVTVPGVGSWVWPTANDPNAENLIHSILSSWCGVTYVDAVKEASEKAAQFDKLRAERDQRYAEWMRCNQERGIRERELEMECERARQVQASTLEREREKIQGECDSEANQLKAELENCDVKLKKKGVGSCQKDLLAERAACDKEKRARQAELAACQEAQSPGNVSRVVELEEAAARAGEHRAAWAAQRKLLTAELNDCRPAQARSRRRLMEVMTDGRVEQLEGKVMWLQVILLNLLLLTGLVGGALVAQLLKEGRADVEGGHGWIRTMPPSRLQLVDADTARTQLVEAFEDNKGSRLAIVLATDIFYGRRRSSSGPNNVFLLVPINITSARRFQLFNQGGDYTLHVERAREIVAKSVENARLLVVLYEAGGCVFTEATLQSLRLTADKVAHEAIPADVDFPQADNLVVLWLDKQEGLRASDSTHESDAVTDNIKCQPWAQYLLMRSGRWGQVHAQFM